MQLSVLLLAWAGLGAIILPAQTNEAAVTLAENKPKILENGGMEVESERKGVPYAWDGCWKDAEKNPDKLAAMQKMCALDPEIKVEGKTSARFSMSQTSGSVTLLSQDFTTIPGQTYCFSAKIRLKDLTARTGGIYITIDSNAEADNRIQLKIPPSAIWSDFEEYAINFTGDSRGRSSCSIFWWKSPCTVWIDDVRIVPVGNPLSPEEKCLTGNFGGEPARNKQIPGTYSVFNGNTTSYDAQAFAMKAVGESAVIDHMLEEWLFGNVVPFDKGQLTSSKGGALSFRNPGNARYQFQIWWVNRTIGGTVVFDLKKDYIVTRVKVRPGTPASTSPTLNADLFLKTNDGRMFTHVGRQNGYGTALFDGLNMKARWVAITARTDEGLHQIEVWGHEDTTKAQAPVPYAWPVVEKKEDKARTNEPAVVFTDVGIYPQPREVKALNGAFLVNKDTPLALVGEKISERSRTTLQTFHEDLAAETGLRLNTQECARASSLPAAAIRLSVRGQSPELDAQLAKQVGTVVTNQDGYTLLVDPRTGIWLAGADEAGMFYGTRALLDLLKKQDNSLSAQALVIRDWPRATLRGIMYNPKPTPFNDRFIRHLARLRYNLVFPLGNIVDMNGTNTAQKLIAYCDRYFVQVLPAMCSIGMQKGMVPEKKADEPTPTGTRCTMCISDEGNRQEYLRRLSAYAPLFNCKYFNISLDEIDHADQGARWNSCPKCLARKMTTQDLYAEWIKKVCAHLRSLGKTPMCYATSCFFEAPFIGVDELIKNDIPILIEYVSMKDRRARIKELGCQGWLQFDSGFLPLMDNEIGGYIANWGDMSAEGMAGQKFAQYVRGANGLWAMSLPAPVECEEQVGRAFARLRAAVTGVPEPSLISQPVDFLPLDLSKQANEPLKDEQAGDGHGWMDEGPGRDLRALPQGKQTFVGIPFLIGDKCLMIENRARLGRILPESISIPIDRKLAGLVFIHTQNQTCDVGEPWYCNMTYLGHYLIHYEDGTFLVHPLRYSVNIQKWDTYGQHTYEATVAWRGQTSLGYPVTLYLDEWVNPYPEKAITRIDFCASKRPRPTRLALVAATAIQARDYNTVVSKDCPEPFKEQQRAVLPAGLKLIPVIGGKYEAEIGALISGGIPQYKSVRYTAPDGIVFASSNTWTRAGEPHLTQALVDNNWDWEANDQTALTVTFPAPRPLKALEIIGCYEDRRFAGLRSQDFVIETSADGTAFTQAAEIKQTMAEVDGRIAVPLSGQPLKALRLIPIRRNDYKYGTIGLAYLAMYE
jgi:hypothetical protein